MPYIPIRYALFFNTLGLEKYNHTRYAAHASVPIPQIHRHFRRPGRINRNRALHRATPSCIIGDPTARHLYQLSVISYQWVYTRAAAKLHMRTKGTRLYHPYKPHEKTIKGYL